GWLTQSTRTGHQSNGKMENRLKLSRQSTRLVSLHGKALPFCRFMVEVLAADSSAMKEVEVVATSVRTTRPQRLKRRRIKLNAKLMQVIR
ncbi:MAG: hypothetical protein ACRD22_11045, partial [Terriglobia bacterium]